MKSKGKPLTTIRLAKYFIFIGITLALTALFMVDAYFSRSEDIAIPSIEHAGLAIILISILSLTVGIILLGTCIKSTFFSKKI